MADGRVQDRVVLVTGAARPQGRSHAVRLAREGAHIIAVDLPGPVGTVDVAIPGPEELEETARLVRSCGRRCVTGRVDVRDRAALGELVDGAVSELGRLDAVVADAGVAATLPHTAIDPGAWSNMIGVNLTGTFFTCQAALRHLIANGPGSSIVLVTSTDAAMGRANRVHHAAAAHGVVGIVRALAKELAPHLITVNAVLTDTPSVVPDDISGAVVFLASHEARYLTGVALPIGAPGNPTSTLVPRGGG